jgi:3-methylcrotonyl-CoA carboxylase alpha subunit
MEPDSPWRVLDGWRLNGSSQQTITLRCGETEQAVTAEVVVDGVLLSIGGDPVLARRTGPSQVQLGDRRLTATVVARAEHLHVFCHGQSWALAKVDLLHGEGADDAHGGVQAPMPGKVIALLAAVGATVEKGTPLLVLEAMKMEHTIHAPRKGTVKAFHFSAGEQVGDGVDLVDFEATE